MQASTRGARRRGAMAGLAIALATFAVGAQAQATFEKIRQRGWINIGYRSNAAPFSLTDAKGQPAGYALEVCGAMVDKLRAAVGVPDLPVKYVAAQVDQRLKLVKEGSLDLLCDSTTDTPERRASVDFSTPIFVDAVQLMVRTKDGIASVDQLKGKQVVVIGSTTAPTVAAQWDASHQMAWKLAKVVDAEAALGQLQIGWVQAYARDGVLLASQRAAAPPGTYAILPERLSSEPIAIAFRKGDAQMRQLVDGGIASAMQSGAFQTWYDKWFVKAAPPAKPLGIPMSDELKTLIAKSR